MQIKTPTSDNFQSLFDLIKVFSDRHEMLPKTMDEILHAAQSYKVFVDESGKVIASAHLDIFTADLAEVKSLAVDPDYQGQGLGKKLVDDCAIQAKDMGIKKLFALTFKDGFFEKLDFTRVTMDSLPEKVYKECVKCSFYGDCKEVAMLRLL